MPLGGSELTGRSLAAALLASLAPKHHTHTHAAGYKGYGLAMMVEVMCGMLGDGPYAHHVRKSTEAPNAGAKHGRKVLFYPNLIHSPSSFKVHSNIIPTKGASAPSAARGTLVPTLSQPHSQSISISFLIHLNPIFILNWFPVPDVCCAGSWGICSQL